jgi:hypothetical protein
VPYDRILRHELLRSPRFIDLPSDTHRLVFTSLLTEADDFGNLEGGPRRLWHWMRGFSQVKNESHAVDLMSALADADLVRRYESGDREYWHIPRFKNQRTYWIRICPASPWCDPLAYTGSYKRVTKQAKKSKSVSDLKKPVSDLKIGVGVGVGENNTTAASPADIPGFEEFCAIYPKRAGGNPKRRAQKAYHARLKEGHGPDEILAGAKRYAAFVRGIKKDGTQYVMQYATFLGPDKHFLDAWELPQAAENPMYSRWGVM